MTRLESGMKIPVDMLRVGCLVCRVRAVAGDRPWSGMAVSVMENASPGAV